MDSLRALVSQSLDLLQPIAEGLWSQRTHLRSMGPLRVPRTMSVVAVEDGLLLHSPNELTPALRVALDELGPVRHLVAPSLMHAAFLSDYRAAYPEARLYAAPGLAARRADLEVDVEIEAETVLPWSEVLAHTLTRGVPRLNEVAFLHQASQTLLLTDFAHNVGADNPLLTRIVFRAIGGYRRFGPTRYFASLVEDRAAVWASIEDIARWEFSRVLMCHGQPVVAGPRELLEAFGDYAPKA